MRSSMQRGPQQLPPLRQPREARMDICLRRFRPNLASSRSSRDRPLINSPTTITMSSDRIHSSSKVHTLKEGSCPNLMRSHHDLPRVKAARAVPAALRLLPVPRPMANQRRVMPMLHRLNIKAKVTEPRMFFHRSSRCLPPFLLCLTNPCPWK